MAWFNSQGGYSRFLRTLCYVGDQETQTERTDKIESAKRDFNLRLILNSNSRNLIDISSQARAFLRTACASTIEPCIPDPEILSTHEN